MSEHAGRPNVSTLVYERAGQDGAHGAVAHETWNEVVVQSDEGAERVGQGRQLVGAALKQSQTFEPPRIIYYYPYYTM